jgi:hypothetical protein
VTKGACCPAKGVNVQCWVLCQICRTWVCCWMCVACTSATVPFQLQTVPQGFAVAVALAPCMQSTCDLSCVLEPIGGWLTVTLQ